MPPWRIRARRSHRKDIMADFFQTGAIATIHRLGPTDLPRLERELTEFGKETPIALVLPCHIREVGTTALKGIVRELKHVPYLKQIVVGIDGAAGLRQWRRSADLLRRSWSPRLCCI